MKPLALLLALVATPAFADAVTYEGTLGKTKIILELSHEITENPDDAIVGRYAYLRKGIDIPLQPVSFTPGAVDLGEEAPCTEDTCRDANGDLIAAPIIAADWHLETDDDGETLTGTWSSNGKTLPIKLSYVARRPFDLGDNTPLALSAFDIFPVVKEEAIDADTMPYDYLRLNADLEEGPITNWDGDAFRYVTDPRTKFPYPRIVALHDDSDPAKANEWLSARHQGRSADALSCASQAYLGLGWYQPNDFELAGYPDETIEVTYLSPQVMSWREAGSLYCGGAHPDNHDNVYNLDVAAGQPLDLSKIFAAWIPTPYQDGKPTDLESARENPSAYHWGPDEALADFVRARRSRDGQDQLNEEQCSYDDLIGSNLSIGFMQPGYVVFGLGELPYVAQACAYDLMSVPITDLKPFLTDEAADYFPELRD